MCPGMTAGIFGQSLIPNRDRSSSLNSFKLDDRLSFSSQNAAIPKFSTPVHSKFSTRPHIAMRDSSLPPSSVSFNRSIERDLGDLEFDVFSSNFDADDPFGFLAAERKLKLRRAAQNAKSRHYDVPRRASILSSMRSRSMSAGLDFVTAVNSSASKSGRNVSQHGSRLSRRDTVSPTSSLIKVGKRTRHDLETSSISNISFTNRKKRSIDPPAALQNVRTQLTKSPPQLKRKKIAKKPKLAEKAKYSNDILEEQAIMAITENLEALLPARPYRNQVSRNRRNITRRSTRRKRNLYVCQLDDGEGESYVLDDDEREVREINSEFTTSRIGFTLPGISTSSTEAN